MENTKYVQGKIFEALGEYAGAYTALEFETVLQDADQVRIPDCWREKTVSMDNGYDKKMSLLDCRHKDIF